MSSKKSDLKSDLTDLLLGDEDSGNSTSDVLHNEPVTIGAPDETEVRHKKRDLALEEQKKRDSKKPDFRPPREKPSAVPPTVPPLPPPSTPSVAQSRIEQLENENDSLRSENQKFEAVNEAHRAQLEEMSKRLIEWEKRYNTMIEKKDLELQLSREELGHRATKLEEAKMQLEELESRFEGEFYRIRVRERELQNRLDILKHEGGAIVRHKDDLVLDLKRQIEKLNYEMDSYRKKKSGHFWSGGSTTRAYEAGNESTSCCSLAS
jgi:hypothetical protein